MKSFLLAFLFIPMISFAQTSQISQKDAKTIDKYALDMCECVNELLSELHPKTMDVILMMAELGEEEALVEVELMMKEMSSEELNVFLDSFSKMEEPEFLDEIDDCDYSDELKEELQEQINNGEGKAHDYLMGYLDEEIECELMKSLYDLGAEVEE